MSVSHRDSTESAPPRRLGDGELDDEIREDGGDDRPSPSPSRADAYIASTSSSNRALETLGSTAALLRVQREHVLVLELASAIVSS